MSPADHNPEKNAGSETERLIELVTHLRSENGCPWDREQTLETLKPYLIEEAYEVVDAIERTIAHPTAKSWATCCSR